jgi:hypothetical protein
MKAAAVLRSKEVRADGTIVEIVVWRLPRTSVERPHDLKYRLYCGRHGRCLVRYDNETGKGDHRHYGDHEEPYHFSGLSQLLADFAADVQKLVGED